MSKNRSKKFRILNEKHADSIDTTLFKKYDGKS